MINILKGLHKEESGQDLIEYALIGLIMRWVPLLVWDSLPEINTEFSKIGNQLT